MTRYSLPLTLRSALVAALIGASPLAADGQALRSAYFLDGFAYGTDLNPAADYDRAGFVSMPMLGNVSAGFRGNVGLGDFIYPNPSGSGCVTLLHPSISVDDALGAFHTDNRLTGDVGVTILAGGFHAFGGFNTISLRARTSFGLSMPYEFFDVMKNLDNRDYTIPAVTADASAWAELSLGHSHAAGDAWRVGGKLKFLLGAGHASFKADNMRLALADENRWTVTVDASADVNVKGATWGAPTQEHYKDGTPYEAVDLANFDVDTDNIGPAGMGVAVDLGAEFDFGKAGLADGLRIAASVQDLGFISWKEGIRASNAGEPFEFDGFNNVQVLDGTGEPLDAQTDRVSDRMTRLFSIRDRGAASSTEMLGATVNVSLEYELPTYRAFSVGVLSTTRLHGSYGWNEERVIATLSPCRWFELSANVGYGTFGLCYGGVVNIHPRGFNLFIGTDHAPGKFAKQGVPLSSRADVSVGINFPIGRSRK